MGKPKHFPSDWKVGKNGVSPFSSVTQSRQTLCDPIDCSTPGLPVHHQLPEFTQTHVHWVGDAIQPSHPLSSPSPPAFHLFQHQGLFNWVSSSHKVAKVLEFQLRHQSFQWIFRTGFEEGIHRAWTPSEACPCWSCLVASQVDSELSAQCLWEWQWKDKTPSGQGNLEDRSYPGYSSPKRKHTLITPTSRQYLSEYNHRLMGY